MLINTFKEEPNKLPKQDVSIIKPGRTSILDF
jgi:hypothetical protein